MKRIRTKLPLLLLLVLSSNGLVRAQSTAITFNVVVKDKKGVTLKGLTASQFEISDGGGKPKAAAVRLIDGGQVVEESGSAKPVEPERRMKLFVLAFEGMGNEGRQQPETPREGNRLEGVSATRGMGNEERRQAKAIALTLLKEDKDPTHLYAVFVLSNQLALLQPFTADRAGLIKAVEVATSGVQNSRFVEIHTAHKRALQQAAAGDLLARTQLKMLFFDARLSSEEQPRRVISFLNSLATGMAGLPGRKAVAYITWGLIVQTNLDAAFQALQARANRAGVSFYGVDSRGLFTYRQNGDVDSFVKGAGGAAEAGTENISISSAPLVELTRTDALDRSQEEVRGNFQANLRVLSEATGGFLIGDTNDPKPLLRQMIDDTHTYYEVTYDPAIANLDGGYRKTSIRVNSKEARVRDRDGYLALAADQMDVLPYEVPMLKALTATPLPAGVPFRSGVIRLQQGKDEVTGSLIVEVPLAGLQYAGNHASGTTAGRLAMLVQLKDAEGNVVRKYSRDLPVGAKSEQLAALQASNFTFREQFTAPPGRYVVETVIADQVSGRMGARRSVFQAPRRTAGVSVSGIAVVRNFQPNQTNLPADEPFQFQQGRITPTLSATLKTVKGAQMALFFTVYPDADAAGGPVPEAVIQYLKEGVELAKAALPLPAADRSGKIPYVFSSPVDTMPPGIYEIKVLVRQGASMAEESVIVTIEGA